MSEAPGLPDEVVFALCDPAIQRATAEPNAYYWRYAEYRILLNRVTAGPKVSVVAYRGNEVVGRGVVDLSKCRDRVKYEADEERTAGAIR